MIYIILYFKLLLLEIVLAQFLLNESFATGKTFVYTFLYDTSLSGHWRNKYKHRTH